MAGFDMILAGGLAGAGDSIVEQARAKREAALRAQEREQERAWEVEDRDRSYAEDRGREQRGYDRQDAAVSEAANVYESLFGTESGGNFGAANSEGYVGRSQFGQARLDDWAQANGAPRVTPEQFRANPDLQVQVEEWHFSDINNFIDDQGLMQFEGQTIAGVPITRSGMVAMAHLGGSNGMKRFLESGGEYNPSDSNGTSLSDYARTHGGLSTDMSGVFRVLANPDTPESVRSDIRNGLGMDPEPGDRPDNPTNQFWNDNGDGTETRYGTVDGALVPVNGSDGQPFTRKIEREAAEVSNTTFTRLNQNPALFDPDDPVADTADPQLVAVVADEISRLMNEEGMSETEAYTAAIRAMVFDDVETRAASGGLFGLGAREAQTEKRFTGTFNYETGAEPEPDGSQPPPEPTMPTDPGQPSLGGDPVAGPAMPAPTDPAERVVGQVYRNARGQLARWNGEGWELVNG
jgi:hypothetical protein